MSHQLFACAANANRTRLPTGHVFSRQVHDLPKFYLGHVQRAAHKSHFLAAKTHRIQRTIYGCSVYQSLHIGDASNFFAAIFARALKHLDGIYDLHHDAAQVLNVLLLHRPL